MATAPATHRSDLDLNKFRKALEAEGARLESEIRNLSAQDETGGTSGELGELTDYDQHPADVGTELFLREQDEAIVRGLRSELEQVQAATRRMEAGSYGICERCEARIPKERLEALPYATLCVRCADEIGGLQ